MGTGTQVRSLLSICYIDEKKCSYLLKCLENYHKKFNEKTGAYSQSPEHDYTSHCADSVRYMANARIQFGRGPGRMTPEKLMQSQANAGYGQKVPPQNKPYMQQPQHNPFGRR